MLIVYAFLYSIIFQNLFLIKYILKIFIRKPGIIFCISMHYSLQLSRNFSSLPAGWDVFFWTIIGILSFYAVIFISRILLSLHRNSAFPCLNLNSLVYVQLFCIYYNAFV